MKMISCFNASLKVLVTAAIVTVAGGLPAVAELVQPQLAQGSIVGQCRATNRSTPIFEAASTTSTTVRLLKADEQVTLASNVTDGFVKVSAPATGFVQAAVLKACGSTSDKPTVGTACRLLKNAAVVNVRPTPSTSRDPIGVVYRNERVTVNLTTGNAVKTYQADGYTWIEIDASRPPVSKSGVGYIFNSVVGQPGSNLVYCQ